LGGVALAGTVVDGVLADFASAAVGVNRGKPKLGGTLTVGTLSDVPNYHIFNGSDGKLDASGFCVANALYDPLFVMSANGKTALPMLALSATPNASYTVWTIKLRSGVTFHNGAPFNAAAVLANYTAAAANTTVGAAIQPIIASVDVVDHMTVAYNMLIPFASFPITLAEQQIAYMADPSALGSSYDGIPIGTGPFRFKSWTVNVESQFVKNHHYWRKDGKGRKLPYLDGINFKTIVDSQARNEALQTGAVDMILQQTGTQIKALKKIPGVSVVTDETQPSDPALNCLIVNTTGTLNQFFAWYGEIPGVPGGYSYVAKGQPIPTAVQDADWLGTLGAVNPSSSQWDTTLKPVLNDLSIRQACAMAINRTTYFKLIDANVGAVANGLYRKTSPFYDNPGYPNYNPSAAKALVDAYKTANNVTTVSFVIDILQGDATALQAFAFFQSQLAAVGITVTDRQLVQSDLIANVISGAYDCATWNQFGGVDPSLNYVWFLSYSATASPSEGGLGLTSLPAGTNIAGAVNFAHQGDPVIEDSMLAALAAKPTSPVEIRAWRTVNSQFAKDVSYLWLDVLVNAWAARDNVQNWAYATGADGTTQVLSPDQGAARWDEIWLS
jgi:ABC-type transport system substrate-binding protein